MLRLFFSSAFLISFYIRNGRKLESRVNRQIGDRSLRNGIPRALLPRLDDSRITNSISPSSPLDRSLFDSPVEKRNWNCAAREIPIVDASANGSFGRDKTNGTEPPPPLFVSHKWRRLPRSTRCLRCLTISPRDTSWKP